MLGFVEHEEEEISSNLSDDENSGGLEIAEATTVDHTQYMTEVKD